MYEIWVAQAVKQHDDAALVTLLDVNRAEQRSVPCCVWCSGDLERNCEGPCSAVIWTSKNVCAWSTAGRDNNANGVGLCEF